MWEGVGGGGGRGAPRRPGRSGRFAKHFPALDAKSNAQIKMLWIACGTADGLIGINRRSRTG